MSAPKYLERVVLGEDRGVLSWVIRGLFLPLTVIYRVGLFVFLGIYSLGLRRRFRLPVPVISVGNITFGGTGKTPAVQTICRLLLERGIRVVVLSRGHGGTVRGSLVVSDGESVIADAAKAGDEPVLLAKSLPGVPVIVGKDRRKSGALACSQFAPEVIVLDDGLQYWQLHRDLDIIVLNARKPFGSGYVMPMGDLREPISGLSRAGLVLLSNSKDLDDAALGKLQKRLSRIAPRAKIFRGSHVPVSFKDMRSGKIYDPDWIELYRVLAFCGIGRPASFVKMLDSLKATISGNLLFPDHHRFTDEDIDLVERERERCGADLVVTTEKDIARLGNSAARINNLVALSIKFEIEEIQSFAEYIYSKINAKGKEASA